MLDPGHLLLDDRALVQFGGDVVRGRPDHLHAVLVRLLVRPGAAEAGQERVVDVDDPAGQLRADLRGHDPHVPGQHHRVDAVRGDQVEQPPLRLGPVCRIRADRDVLERHPVPRREPGEVGMVPDDQRHVDGQRLRLPAVQQVVEAVSLPGHHDQHARPDGQIMQVPVHAELVRDGREPGAQGREVRRRGAEHLDVHPHEEAVHGQVRELLAVQDVAARAVQERGDRVDDARPVGAGQREHQLPGARGGLAAAVSRRPHGRRRQSARSRRWSRGTSRTAARRRPGRRVPGP